MSYQSVTVVGVRIWGKEVGALALDPESGYYVFEYNKDWIEHGQELAPINMPLGPRKYVFPDLGIDKFQRLPAMIADALPDAFGNAVVNAYLAEEGIPADEISVLDRLAYIGDRAMGALTFYPPSGEETLDSTAIHLADLVSAAKSVVSGQLGSEEENRNAIRQLIQVGTSAGGARPKALIAYDPKTEFIRSGQIDALPGYEQWLIKFDGVLGSTASGSIDLMAPGEFCRTEYAYYLMARDAGIEISDSMLLREGNRAHFMTRRFDRGLNNSRIHLQSLCAMAHLDYGMIATHSYAQYFQTIDRLELGDEAKQEAFRRMVFNVVALNRDDHTKNFAFLMPQGAPWKLAPAYDLTYAHDDQNKWIKNHLMAVNGKSAGISLSDMRTVGDKFLIHDREAVITQVFDAVSRWPVFAKTAGVSSATIARIHEDMLANRPGRTLPTI